MPPEQSILYMDNPHGHTMDRFLKFLNGDCNTTGYFLPACCTDELQPVDAGHGRLVKVDVRMGLGKWPEQGANLEEWECNTLTASERRVFITSCTADAVTRIKALSNYRHSLFEKPRLVMTANGSRDSGGPIGTVQLHGSRNRQRRNV